MTPLKLSKQEERITLLAMTGCTDQEAAQELGLSLDTVRTYWKRIRKKMDGKTRAEIITFLSRAPVTEELEEMRTQSAFLREEIEKRKEAERKCKESEARYKALFDNSLDAIFLRHDDGKYLDVNPAAAKLLGYEQRELIGRSYLQFVADGSLETAKCALRSLRQAGMWEGKFAMKKKNGGTVTLFWRSVRSVLPGITLAVGREVR
jgi:PAS domain S-box-containing protein